MTLFLELAIATCKPSVKMMIEYHHGFASLVDRLSKAGFHATYSRPFDYHNSVTGVAEVVGFIRAVRRT